MGRKKYKVTTLICTVCGQKMFVPRTRPRETGHIKHMYCPKCRITQAFVQVDEWTTRLENS